MKWTIHELRKLSYTNNQFEYLCECDKFINEDILDLVDISLADVKGRFNIIEENRLYLFELHIKVTLTMLCAITLKPVDVPLDFETALHFSKTFIDDDTHVIDGITIDLDPYVWAEILVEKPMKVVSKNASNPCLEELATIDEEEILTDNPFNNLKE
ncbi:MAG: DUF177 domain-containing protein [Firmicutes bacterium]|nr:DUF177 domain-containing protein [Bacillota bacterium]